MKMRIVERCISCVNIILLLIVIVIGLLELPSIMLTGHENLVISVIILFGDIFVREIVYGEIVFAVE